MQTFTERLALFALEFNQTMRYVILVEKIVELMSVPRAACCEYAQACKLAIAPQTSSARECVLELEAPRGTLRIDLKGMALAELTEISRVLWEMLA